jgi:hypothetical protein
VAGAHRGFRDGASDRAFTCGAAFPPIGRAGSWSPGQPSVQRSHLPARPGAGARGGLRRSVPTYRQGRELALEVAIGAAFPPIGKAGSRGSRWPSVQHPHLSARPGVGARGGHRCSIPTYRQGRESGLEVAIGAASPPIGKAGSRGSRWPSVQHPHLPARPGDGARSGLRCSDPTYRQGRELALEVAIGAASPPIGRAGSRGSRWPSVQHPHLSARPGVGARGGHRCSIPTYRHGRELALEVACGAAFPPISRAGCWRPERPAVQRPHLCRGRESAPGAAIGAAFPPTGTAGALAPRAACGAASPPMPRPRIGAWGSHRCSVPTYRNGRGSSYFHGRWRSSQPLSKPGALPRLEVACGAAFPPTGRAENRRPGWPSAQHSHLPTGPGLIVLSRTVAIVAAPFQARRVAEARGGHRCSIPTYRQGREPGLEVAIGAASPPTGTARRRRPERPAVQRSHLSAGQGAGARSGHRCSVPTYRNGRGSSYFHGRWRSSQPFPSQARCRGSRWPAVQRSHLLAGPRIGAQGGHRRSIPTYRQGQETAPGAACGAASPPTGTAGSRRSRWPSARHSHLSAGPGDGARSGLRSSVPTYALTAGNSARGGQRCSKLILPEEGSGYRY